MKKETGKLPLQIGLLISVVVMIAVNALANILPIAGRHTGEISDSIPNLFVPAGITFAIWGLIYLLLVVFVVFQSRDMFSRKKREMNFLHRAGWLLIVNFLANAAWIIAWHNLQIVLSLVLMLVILATLIAAYVRLDIGVSSAPLSENICVRIPVSVYLGWICVATIANVTAFLVTSGWNPGGPAEIWLTAAMIVAAAGLALASLLLRRDIALSCVVIWALLGIYLKRTGAGVPPVPEVSLTALICLLTVSAGAIATAIRLIAVARKKRTA